MLLAGYLYVHATIAWLGPRKQALLHAVLLLIPLVLLPIRVLSGFGMTSELRPISSVILVLLASVGLPFFVVSTTAPLLQRWFGGTTHRLARDPFFLYAASNLGSIGALLAYPTLVEPKFHLDSQARAWSFGYGLLVVLTIACVLAVRRALPVTAPNEITDEPPVPWRQRLRWIALAAVPSSLMLSVTTHITTNIAPIPLLWVIPLTIYLLTFVLAFSPRLGFLRVFARYAFPVVVFIPLATMLAEIVEPPGFMLFHLIVFAIAALLCHGELAASRPGVGRLTEFYVWLAIGGAVGGIFNVLIAPFLFKTTFEYPLGLVLACLLMPRGAKSSEGSRSGRKDIGLAVGVGLLAFVVAHFVGDSIAPKGTLSFAVYVFALPAVIALIFFAKRPTRFALAVAAATLVVFLYPNSRETVVARERSFYGVYRIVDRPYYRILFHGNTNHGAQAHELNRRCAPLSYYYPTGPLGNVFASFARGMIPRTNVGIVGLGTGSIGGYWLKGQAWTFYEIDPKVEQIARNPLYFSFLADCVPNARVILGDARISLAKQPDQVHDLIIVDAFSSDAIPIHLITREAMDLYLRKLKPNGVLAFHISNQHVYLWPQMGRVARDEKLVAYLREDNYATEAEKNEGKTPSVWVAMARTDNDLGPLPHHPEWHQLQPDVKGESWTDNYSNIFEALRLK
jgi:hypothetical protein